MMKTMPLVKIADRTLGVFEAFARTAKPASLSEVAELLSIPISSCHSLLGTLEARGYVRAIRPRGAYYPTRRMLEVAKAIADNDQLLHRIEAPMAALRDTTGETVVIGQRRGREAVYIHIAESRAAIRYSAAIGETRPLHANSIGKALLAAMSAADRAELMAEAPLAPLTEATLISVSALERDLADGKARGWFQNIAESSPDVSAIACPVEIDGQPFGLSVVGPRERILARIDALAAHLQKAVATITGDRSEVV